tara:strand:- start:225 stop:434 length:210 start_codon:yes stop_codon:yes gene_type:complete
MVYESSILSYSTNIKINKMSKRFKLELAIFLFEYSKNKFDCDGFDLLPEKHKEWIRNEVINEMDQLLRL